MQEPGVSTSRSGYARLLRQTKRGRSSDHRLLQVAGSELPISTAAAGSLRLRGAATTSTGCRQGKALQG